jgi:quinol monooxygenase YgiN
VANGIMINSDNVLLLRPVSSTDGLLSGSAPRPQPGHGGNAPGLVVATSCYLAPNTDDAFHEFFERDVRPVLAQTCACIVAALVTERSPNTFPRLPVREGETVFVWLSSFPSLAAYEAHLAALAACETWTGAVLPEMERRTWRRNEVARLLPTARSRLHGQTIEAARDPHQT